MIAVVASALVLGAARTPVVSYPVRRLNDVLYDSFYRLRPAQDRTDGPVVLVVVDQHSLDIVDQQKQLGWPWPRQYWGDLIAYLQRSGAQAVGIDLLFSERSEYNGSWDDDADFAAAIDSARVPLVLGTVVSPDGKPGRFAPPVSKSPTFGATNITLPDDDASRSYVPFVSGKPSLAAALVTQSSANHPPIPAQPFLLHYYGPDELPGGRHTFRYVPAVNLLTAALPRKQPLSPAEIQALGVDPAVFRGKFVIIGIIAAGGYDQKVSPLSAQCPGVELHATAVENLLAGQFVLPIGPGGTHAATFAVAFLAAAGAAVPRRAWAKILLPMLVLAAAVAAAAMLFHGEPIRWLAPATMIAAGLLSTGGGLAWSYFIEDRQRRFFLKALADCVSPAVADELARDPAKLRVGGERREMTVMFTDIAGFTELSSTLDAERLSQLINFYLDEMSEVVFAANGTLDKYVGDAIVTFWNAPIGQPDHAFAACRAALAMCQRERAIQPRLRELGAESIYTRIGINTGAMAVGFVGSSRKLNYTVLGDAVNLGSRLEGANKIYGTRILLSEATALAVAGEFVVRRIDFLRVKGHPKPMPVYELMNCAADGNGLKELAVQYEEALSAYEARSWESARAMLVEILEKFPQDEPSRVLLERAMLYAHDPPPADWDGSYAAKEK